MPRDACACDPLELHAIIQALNCLSCRFDVDVLAECDSTNTQLLALAEIGAPSGKVLVAECQTAGRGRRGRNWFASPGDSLAFSLLWRFPATTPVTGLSLAVGVALAQALENLGMAGIRLKWPNDLLIVGKQGHPRKLAGILIELASGKNDSGTVAAVIGIGINLRLSPEMPEELRVTSASLDELDANLPSRSILLAKMLISLHATLQTFAASGFTPLRETWQSRHAFEGRTIHLLSDHAAPVEGICRGVDADGALLLETPSGLQRFISGEVSLRLV